MEVFDRKKALEMLEGEEELLEELEMAFVERIFDFEYLLGLEDRGQLNEAAGYVHSFKGSARQLACDSCAKSGQKLEDYLRGKIAVKSAEDAKALNEDFRRELERAVKLISEDLNGRKADL